MSMRIRAVAVVLSAFATLASTGRVQDTSPATRKGDGWEVVFHFPDAFKPGEKQGLIIKFKKSLIGATEQKQKLRIELYEYDKAGFDDKVKTYYHDERCCVTMRACANEGWKGVTRECVKEKDAHEIEVDVDVVNQTLEGSVLYYTDWGRYERGLRKGNIELYVKIKAPGRDFSNKDHLVVVPMKKR